MNTSMLKTEPMFPEPSPTDDRMATTERPDRDRDSHRASRGLDSGAGYYDTWLDATHGVMWAMLRPECPPRFTRELVHALRAGQAELAARVRDEVARGEANRVRYQVFGSRIPGVFSLGGDLPLFCNLVGRGNREALLEYALECVDLVYANAVNHRLPLTMISLVQGDALGGGFEAALAANVVVAERGCKLGFPEVLFNLFPGMGAYQLLTRRLPPVRAERLIMSGRIHTAEELHALGVIDILADPGKGEEAVSGYIRRHHRQARARQAFSLAVEASEPVDIEGMRRIAGAWVDCAMNLTRDDLRVVDYLVRAQAQRVS